MIGYLLVLASLILFAFIIFILKFISYKINETKLFKHKYKNNDERRIIK